MSLISMLGVSELLREGSCSHSTGTVATLARWQECFAECNKAFAAI